MKKCDGFSYIFLLLIGIYVCLHAYKIDIGSFNEPGPGFVFFLAGGILSALALIGFISVFHQSLEEDETFKKIWSGVRWSKLIIVLVSLWAWIFSLNYLGFFIGTFLLLILLFRIVEPTKWWIAIFASLITIIVSYYIFDFWLSVPLPRGLIGI